MSRKERREGAALPFSGDDDASHQAGGHRRNDDQQARHEIPAGIGFIVEPRSGDDGHGRQIGVLHARRDAPLLDHLGSGLRQDAGGIVAKDHG